MTDSNNSHFLGGYSFGTQLWLEFVKFYLALPYALVYVFICVINEVELLAEVLDVLSEWYHF